MAAGKTGTQTRKDRKYFKFDSLVAWIRTPALVAWMCNLEAWIHNLELSLSLEEGYPNLKAGKAYI